MARSLATVLRRTPEGNYTSADGRFRVTVAYDSSAVTRGRGPRYWIVSDTTGRNGPPNFAGTLREARRMIQSMK
jgi:hypothetical protein